MLVCSMMALGRESERRKKKGSRDKHKCMRHTHTVHVFTHTHTPRAFSSPSVRSKVVLHSLAVFSGIHSIGDIWPVMAVLFLDPLFEHSYSTEGREYRAGVRVHGSN